MKNNDFHIDRKRLKAAFDFEKQSGQWSRFDPDGDNFDFGYEMALTFKVRINMIKIIRKEVVAHNFRLWDQANEITSAKFSTEKSIKECGLPSHWQYEIHDKNLLKAVNDNGLSYLGKLKDNQTYEFGGILVKRKILLRRVEMLC
jgi:hypothetical protein